MPQSSAVCFERMQQLTNREVIVTLRPVSALQPAGGQRVEKDLAG